MQGSGPISLAFFAGVLLLCWNPSMAGEPARPQHSAQAPQWVSPVVHAPGLEHRVFQSRIVDSQISYHVYLPPGYDTNATERYHVVYWLHGGGGARERQYSAGGGIGPAAVSRHFGDAMRSGKIAPFLIVFPNGLCGGMWCDSKDKTTPVESILIEELIPEVDAEFRTIPSREGRLIEGHSMGGYGAARLGFSYPDLFCGVSCRAAGPLQQVFSPAIGPRGNAATRAAVLRSIYGSDQEYFRSLSPWHIAEENDGQLRGKMPIRLLIGEEDRTLPANREFHAHLERLQIPHTFRVLPHVKHDARQLMETLRDDNEYWAFYRTAFGMKAR